MILYATPTLILCFVAWLFLTAASKKAQSDLLKDESSAWLINSLITAMIELGLIIVFFLQSTSIGWLAHYIDQILVIVMCLLFIGDRLKLITASLAELVMCAAGKDHVQPLKETFDVHKTSLEIHFVIQDIIAAKVGRKTFVILFIRPSVSHIELDNYCQFTDCATQIAAQVYSQISTFTALSKNRNKIKPWSKKQRHVYCVRCESFLATDADVLLMPGAIHVK